MEIQLTVKAQMTNFKDLLLFALREHADIEVSEPQLIIAEIDNVEVSATQCGEMLHLTFKGANQTKIEEIAHIVNMNLDEKQ